MNQHVPVVDFRLGDVVELRKPHPCGGHIWEVVRLGADIGLKCRTCGRRVLLPRSTVERRMKRFVERGPESTTVEVGHERGEVRAEEAEATPDAAS